MARGIMYGHKTELDNLRLICVREENGDDVIEGPPGGSTTIMIPVNYNCNIDLNDGSGILMVHTPGYPREFRGPISCKFVVMKGDWGPTTDWTVSEFYVSSFSFFRSAA